MEAVNTSAKLSMMKAVAEVKALPDYATSGEVCARIHVPLHTVPMLVIYNVVSPDSGSLLMLDMIRRPMPSIRLSLVYPEGNCVLVLYNIMCTCNFII